MYSKRLRTVILLCLALLLSPAAVCESFGNEIQKNQGKRFEVSKERFHLIIEDSLVTLESEDAELGSVLKEMSRGMGIGISSQLQRKVSVSFRDLPLSAALKRLVSNWGIVFSKKKGQRVPGISRVFCLTKSEKSDREEPEGQEPSGHHPFQYLEESRPLPRAFDSSQHSPFQIKSPETGTSAKMAPHELIVRFRKDVSKKEALDLIKKAGASVKSHIIPLRYYVLSLPSDIPVENASHFFEKHDLVEKAEPNYLIPLKMLPNDPGFSEQWSLKNNGQNGGIEGADIAATAAWEVEEGDEGIVVAVVDTGVDYSHPDLSSNIWHNPGEIPGNGRDDDGNGYVDDVTGWDFVDASGGSPEEDWKTPDNDPMDRDGHGTHVAGIIGAVANNGRGIAGVAWRCRIMPVRAGYRTVSGDGILESDDAAQAIVYAADNGARVINLSWGDTQESGVILDAIDYAAQKGALICAAAGNENANSPSYPAASDIDAVLAVGATDSSDRKASFSNYGEWVDVFAPGTAIYSTFPNNSYKTMSGTSMATPHVSGLAGLILSSMPGLTALETKARIMRSADVLMNLGGKNITSGRINAFKALAAVFYTPHIFSLNPTTVHWGELVSIFGDRFGEEQGNGSVIFDSEKECEIISWNNTVIVCRVPEETQTSEVVVNTPEGTSNSFTISVLPKFYEEKLVESAFMGKGEAQGWQADDQSWPLELPFIFSFFGRQYNQVHVSSNGFLLFSEEPVPITNSEETLKERLMIAPLWDDLITNGSSQMNEDIYIDTPSVDAVCIRWKAERYETRDPVNVEVVLYQDGRILFNYGAGNKGLSPTVGISGGDGVRFNLASYDDKISVSQTRTIVFDPIEQPFTIALEEGWNLISLPLEPSENQVSRILGSVSSGIESVWGLEQGIWKVYFPAEPGMSDLEVMKPGVSYWIRATEPDLTVQVQ